MPAVDKLVFAGLNHLLRSETWAWERLRQHAGAQVLIEAGPLRLNLRIDERGLLGFGEHSRAAEVTITLPADTPVRFLLDRDNLFSSVKIAGSVDIAESLAFVFRHLKWDVEADLASVVGDVPARRLALFGKQFGLRLQDGTRRLAENMVEFATEDSSLLAAHRDVECFSKEVDHLRDDTARLEKRIARL
jgi:ubiquinone biosynthesis protein UbiJ